MVYNIYGLSRKWWGGGGVTRQIASEIFVPGSIPKIANFVFYGQRTENG
jgi:hypothetical protein